MSFEARLILATLRGEDVAPDQSIEWHRVLILAESHGVLSPFCKAYRHDLPAAIQDALQRQWTSSAFMASELEDLLRAFSAADIDVVPLKGPVLADLLYRSISARVSDDLDLLVRPEDFPCAQQLLHTLGFLQIDVDGNYHQAFIRENTFVELHFSLVSPSMPSMKLENVWSRTRQIDFRGQSIAAFSKPDLALYTIVHGVKHHFSRLVWLLDIARALECLDEPQWVQLLDLSGETGIQGACLTSCELARQAFGISLPSAVQSAIDAKPGILRQARAIYDRLLERPAHPQAFIDDAGLFVLLEPSYLWRLNHRLRFFRPTPQDYHWAREHRIPRPLVWFTRPFRLVAKHGPAIAFSTFFPSTMKRLRLLNGTPATQVPPAPSIQRPG